MNTDFLHTDNIWRDKMPIDKDDISNTFFKTFEIEPTVYSIWDSKETQIKNFKSFTVYPEISDHKLLQMICVLSAYNYIFEDLKADDIEQLKEEIIKLFFDYPLIAEEEKVKIQQLFKEGK